MKYATTLFFVFIFIGCSNTNSYCPKYPIPNNTVLKKIQSLNDSEVDKWMIEQYKLNLKLKECNGL